MSEEIIGGALGCLDRLTVSYVATCDGGLPYVRPMMLIYVDGVFYDATGAVDAKVAQLMVNPKTVVCVLLGEGEGGGRLSLIGEMRFVKDEGVRA